MPRRAACLTGTPGGAMPCAEALCGFIIWSHSSPLRWGRFLCPLTAEVAEACRGHTASNQHSQVRTSAAWSSLPIPPCSPSSSTPGVRARGVPMRTGTVGGTLSGRAPDLWLPQGTAHP